MLKHKLLRIGNLIIILALILMVSSPIAAAGNREAAQKALDYLKTVQDDDGGWGDIGNTSYIIFAIASSGQDPNSWIKNGKSPIDYLEVNAPNLASEDMEKRVGKIAQLIMALAIADKDLTDFAGYNWITKLYEGYHPTTGEFGFLNGNDSCNHMWAMFALTAADETVPAEAISWLKGHQNANGSWSYDVSDTSGDTNSTALAIQALTACGESSSAQLIQKAIDYLRSQQNDDGGFPWIKPYDSDANSDAWVIQGLLAADEDPTGPAWTKNGNNPESNLLSFQNQANGAFQVVQWGTGDLIDDLMATYQAILALYEEPFAEELFTKSDIPQVSTPAPAYSEYTSVNRLWGQTSSDTAIAISQTGWSSSRVAVIARDDYFTDAVAGGPLAYAASYYYGSPSPILLTGSHKRPDGLVFEVMRLGAHKIYLLGGPGAVDESVEASLNDIPGVTEVVRLWGQTSYGTAQAIKDEINHLCDLGGVPRPDTAVIATGESFPDSLAISGPAASKNMPILLVKPFAGEPQPETQVALSGIEQTVIVGGPGAVHPTLENWLNQNGHKVEKRLWGLSEYDTAIDITSTGASVFAFDLSTTFVTRGDYFTDALAGGAYAAKLGPAPIVLVRPESIPQSTKLWLQNNKNFISQINVLGGCGAVSDIVMQEVEQL